MARRLTITVAVALAAVAFGLAVAACGGGPSKEQEAADAQAQARWQSGLTRWSTEMTRALNGISALLSNSESVTRLVRGDVRTLAQLDRFERTLAGCTAAVARVGPPPVALTTAREEALRACRSLARGARMMRAGVAAWRSSGTGIAAVNRAGETLGEGQRGLVRVRAALKAAIGSGDAAS